MTSNSPEKYGRQALVDLDALEEAYRERGDDRADRAEWLANEIRGLINGEAK